MVNLKKHRGWAALAATAVFAAGYGANQLSRPPTCAELDADYMPRALGLAREYSRTAKSQLVFLGENSDAPMHFESSSIRPADITDDRLDALKGIYEQAAALHRDIRDTELKGGSCYLGKSSTVRLYVSNELRGLMQKIHGMMNAAPESFQHLKKYRLDSTTPASPERTPEPQTAPPSMPLPAPHQPALIIA